MLSEIKTKKVSWINLESPTKTEIAELQKKYALHPLVAEELNQPTIRPKADIYDENIYLILHFPIYDIKKRTSASKEIDFVIGKNLLITVHYDIITPLDEFFKMTGIDSLLRKKVLAENSGFAFFYLLKQLYDFSLRETDHIQKKIEQIEENIFRDKEKQMVRAISLIKRDLLDFSRAIGPHGMILKSLAKNTGKFFGKNFSPYLNDLIGEHFKIKNLMENHQQIINALETTNESLLATKTNEIMKVLTIMAFITFPLMLLSDLFGMNTKYLPLIGMKGDFWVIIGIMLAATLGMFFFFKRKKWI
jgi:magnesium transporter